MPEASIQTTVRVYHPFLFAAWPLLHFLVRDSAPGDARLILTYVGMILATAILYLALRFVVRDRHRAGALLSIGIVAWLSYQPLHSIACNLNEWLGIEFLRSEYSPVRHRYMLAAIGCIAIIACGSLLITRASLRRVTQAMNIAAIILIGFAASRVAYAKWTAPPFGIDQRVAWTTSRIKGTPDPPSAYITTQVFKNLAFQQPLALTFAPGSDRLFIVEQFGKVYSFENDPEVANADLMLEIERTELYGLAFHPQFQQNQYVYVSYLCDQNDDSPRRIQVSRFRSSGSPPRIDVATETPVIDWACDGHHGGCLKFGPDGYLYIATGDGSGIADEYETGQDLSKLQGSILRIDVDRANGPLEYSIPADNPFVETENARPEIWAYGLREPWKMTFDRETGDLWVSNVGQDLWETIYRIERGGNYGWSLVEGSHPFRPERQQGPSPILPPAAEHHHSDARSLTGGYVYRGSKHEELQGAYLYGDYDFGKVWSLRYDDEPSGEPQLLVDSSLRIVGFAETEQGELYLLDHMRGTIHQLAENPVTESNSDFPRKLSETGLFASTKDHLPAAGVIPYSINAPAWADGATKESFLALPAGSQIEFDAMIYPSAEAPAGWKFPDGTVIAETIFLEMEKGNPDSRRRLETRVLHHERLAGSSEVGDQSWRGYTFVWNDEQTDAVLLEEPAGLDRTFTIIDPDAANSQRQQTWHFPSHTECVACHNMAAKYVIAVNTPQMNRSHDYGGVRDNQLRVLEHLGIFRSRLPQSPAQLPRLPDYHDPSVAIEDRARTYLHANCAHCHRKWGGGNADFQLLATLSLTETKAVHSPPHHGTFDLTDAAIVAPGDPARSVLAFRMASSGTGRMPRIGSRVIDPSGLNLVCQWIDSMSSDTRTTAETPPAITQLQSSIHPETPSIAAMDQLLASTTGALQLMRAIDQGELTNSIETAAIQRGTEHANPLVRDLFERFIPEEQRTQRLGTSINADAILELAGDDHRGKDVFFATAGAACKNCHQINGVGSRLGPDLSQIGNKMNRSQILESILEPSKRIDPAYIEFLVMTIDGRIHRGMMLKNDSEGMELINATAERIHLLADEVETVRPQTESVMPKFLVRDMTAQQVADLIAYLSQLGKGPSLAPVRAAEESNGDKLR